MKDSSLKVRGMLALLASSAFIIFLLGFLLGKPSQSPILETKTAPSSPAPSIQVQVQAQAQAQAKTNPPSQPPSHSSGTPTNVVSQILSKNTPAEVRREALYQLTQTHSDTATQSLIEIAASSVDAKDESSRFDVSLRITALEAIDQRMASGEATASAITAVLEKQTHPTLLFFARISLEGVTSGRPGKLTRFIDKAFSEVGAG